MTKSSELGIVVTGASGFVGKNTRKFLATKEVRLFGISRKNFTSYKNEKKIISPKLSVGEISTKLKNCKALIHLIGTGRQTAESTYEQVNVENTKKIIQLCKRSKIKKIIYISGLGVSKESVSAYFISKYSAEREIVESGLDYTILRASYIIGKEDSLTKILNRQIKKKTILVPGSGNYHIQPIFVNDVAKVILNSILSKKFSKKIIDLVGPDTVTFNEYVRLFKGKSKAKIKKLPLEQAYNDALHNPKNDFGVDDLNILVGDFIGNHKKLKKLCGFEFESFRNIS